MSSGIALRNRGSRRPSSTKIVGPTQSLQQTGRPGEKKLNRAQIEAIQHLYRTHPAISAARAVLQGQLLSGGIVLKRQGETVELKAAFKNHLDEVWVPFASDVMDSFLMFGYTVLVYDQDDESVQQKRAKRLKAAKGGIAEDPVNFIPLVPTIDTYDLSYVHTGRMGYKRQYLVHATAPGQTAKIDEDARVVIRTPPDATGNLNSPMAVVFDQGSFVSALTELALQAETTNSRPRLWAQMRQPKTGTGLDPQALFFDSTSRDVQSSQNADDNQAQLSALALQQQLCSVINKLQSGPGTGGLDIQTGSFNSGGGSGSKSHVPPEASLACGFEPHLDISPFNAGFMYLPLPTLRSQVQPSLFVLPKGACAATVCFVPCVGVDCRPTSRRDDVMRVFGRPGSHARGGPDAPDARRLGGALEAGD